MYWCHICDGWYNNKTKYQTDAHSTVCCVLWILASSHRGRHFIATDPCKQGSVKKKNTSMVQINMDPSMFYFCVCTPLLFFCLNIVLCLNNCFCVWILFLCSNTWTILCLNTFVCLYTNPLFSLIGSRNLWKSRRFLGPIKTFIWCPHLLMSERSK